MDPDLNSLERAILATVIYYDLLGLPLTSFEIFKYLVKVPGLDNRDQRIGFPGILEALEQSSFLEKTVGQKLGFYFLPGRERLVEDRIETQKLVDLKWRKLRRYGRFFWALPFLKMVLATGSFALGNAEDGSDFDVLVVARHGRIWTLRFFATTLFYLLGIRRSAQKVKDRICLSHYVSDRALAMRCRNIYEAQYYCRAVPLVEAENGFYGRFCRQNRWLGDYLVFWPPEIFRREGSANDRRTGLAPVSLKTLPESKPFRFMARLAEKILGGAIGDFLEKRLASVQQYHINRNPLRYLEGERSRTDDFELEFRPNSQSLAIVRKYKKKAAELI